ncbi:MAG: uroporphyrinogen decarboxylase family protein [Puniceicoccaceae bacterium]
MDSSRETVYKAIEFRRPERLPISGHGSASDTLLLMPDWPGGAPPEGGADEWGCIWSHTHAKNIGQVTGHPLENLKDLSRFHFPDPTAPARFATVARRVRAIETGPKKERFRITAIWNTVWERMHMLHGFENCLIALIEDEPGIHELADRIVDWCIAHIHAMHRQAGSSIDAFMLTDDWGTENSLMISPSLFESFFLSRYKRLFDAVHEKGWKVWMHSCGRINDAIPLLIEAGVDVLNMQQPRVNGIEETGDRFAGNVAFETLCDIQKTLPVGDTDAIRDEASRLLRHWGTEKGGFILGDYGDAGAIGAPPEAKAVMLEAFQDLDRWKARSDSEF